MAQRRRSKLTVAARGTLPQVSLAAARETDEAFRTWQRTLAERVELPAPASVIGEPVTVVDVNYAGNPRRGVIVRCRRSDGREYTVSVGPDPLSRLDAVAPREHASTTTAGFRGAPDP